MERLKPVTIDKVSFYLKNEPIIIDDKNIDRLTLGERRAILLSKKVKLYKLKNAIFFFGDFIKLALSGYYFIDSNGLIFTYIKTKNVPLVFKKINNIIPIKTGGALLEIEGIPTRFKCLELPTNVKYAGLLKISSIEYILYGTYSEKPKDTRRKI